LVDAALAIPRLFVILLLLVVWERIPLAALILVLGTTGWFATSRLVRGEVLRLRHEAFVLAVEGLGARPARTVIRHLLPNAAGPFAPRGPRSPQRMLTLLEVRDLTITFPAERGAIAMPVAHLDFRIARGETLALVGESGSGKTLTGLALLGLVPPPGRLSAASR